MTRKNKSIRQLKKAAIHSERAGRKGMGFLFRSRAKQIKASKRKAKNPAKTSVKLTNFTGSVRLLKSGRVKIEGREKR